MSILVFEAYYEPENIASTYIAEGIRRGFIEAGYRVKLYVPTPSRGLSAEQIAQYSKKRYETKYDGKMEIYRYPMYAEKTGTMQRMLRYLCCNIIQLYFGIKSKNVEAIFAASTPPTHGITIAILKKLKKIPVVYSLQDVFPDSLVQTGLASEKSILFKIGTKLEQFSYKNIDHIVVPSKSIKENLLKKFVPEEKITVIRNWVNEQDVYPISREQNQLFDEFGLSKEAFYIVYAGNMGPAQDIETILDAAVKIQDNTNICFVLFGRGTQYEEHKQMAQKKRLKNMIFLPLQPYARVSEVYSLGDACIVSCKAGMGKTALPSKTWSIMAAERPVLANFDRSSDLEEILRETSSGLLNDSGKSEDLVNNILNLYKNREECIRMGKRGRKYVMKCLNKEHGVSQYVSCLKSVMGEKNEK